MSFFNLIPTILGAGTSIFTSAQNRSNIKDQTEALIKEYEYLDEENDENRAHQLAMMKLQAELQDDEQEDNQKKIIIGIAGIGGIAVLIIIIMIVKALMK